MFSKNGGAATGSSRLQQTGEMAMAEWGEVQKHMRANYSLQNDDGEMFSVVWSYDDGRSQKIIVRRYMSNDRVMVEFKSPFAKRGQIDPEALLRQNSQMTLATIALSGDVVLAIYNLLLDSASIDDVEYVLRRVASIADALEAEYAGGDVF